MKIFHKTGFLAGIALLSLTADLSGCAAEKQAAVMQSEATKKIETAMDREDPVRAVVTKTPGLWLMGQPIKVAPTLPPVLTKSLTYHPAQRVSLSDIAAYITAETGLIVDISETQFTDTSGAMGFSSAGKLGGQISSSPSMMGAGVVGMTPPPPMGGGTPGATSPGSSAGASIPPMRIEYEGLVSGLLDLVANKSAIWWKFSDGKVVFYRTETKTFYLPTNSRKSTGSSTITTSSGAGVSGSGASVTSDYAVDVWNDIEKIAKTVADGAQIVANASTGSLTVTGTPPQVSALEEWVKGMNEQLSQQVAISVHMYQVKMTKEDTYNWDPTFVFQKTGGTFGFNVTPGTPLVPTGGATVPALSFSVLTGAPRKWGQYSGSKAVVEALSTMGDVTETMQETFVTLNGQPAQKQIASQIGYLASSSTTQTANAGTTTSLTPGTLTVGFTATFLPRIVNGKVVLNMTMTNSSSNGFLSVSSAGSSIQTPNVDLSTFQQSVSLTPGDVLLLTGVQQGKSRASNNGVGAPSFKFLGGGANSSTDKSMIAIVITARVL